MGKGLLFTACREIRRNHVKCIRMDSLLILGIPGETPSTIEETLNYLRKLHFEDELTDTFLDLEQGTLGIPSSFALYRMVQSHEKQIEILKYLETMLDKDEISPEKIIECARIIRMATSSKRKSFKTSSKFTLPP